MQILKSGAVGSFALALWMTFHILAILHPQIREMTRKFNLPEFQGTVHQQAIQCTLDRLRRRLSFLRKATGLLILLGLILAAVSWVVGG